AVRGADKNVILARMERDGHISWQGPGRGRPDDEIGARQIAERREQALIVADAALETDGGAGVILIFDLSHCERGLILRAPVDGLQALIDVALAVHLPERTDLGRLETGGHCEIRVVPVTDNAQTLEGLTLDVHKVRGEIPAGAAEGGDRHPAAVKLVFLDDGA